MLGGLLYNHDILHLGLFFLGGGGGTLTGRTPETFVHARFPRGTKEDSHVRHTFVYSSHAVDALVDGSESEVADRADPVADEEEMVYLFAFPVFDGVKERVLEAALNDARTRLTLPHRTPLVGLAEEGGGGGEERGGGGGLGGEEEGAG